DRIARGAAQADVLADVLGASPEVARVVLGRYAEAVAGGPAALRPVLSA
ncbi:sirohydrochlorin chelatase, partial [Streptomyces sp. NPDC096080]